jgi:predicted branched-subunit amino acid permease
MTTDDNPDETRSPRAVVRDSIAVGVATGTYGIAFGAAGVAAGLSVMQTCLTSLLIFTGASQFALVSVLGAAAGGAVTGAVVSSAVGSALLLGARNALYGVRLSGLLRWRGWRRAVVAQGVIDESSAMAFAQPTRATARLAFLATAASVFVLWNLATLAGAAGATALGDPAVFGLDAAVPAGFLALLAPRLREGPPERRVAAAGAVIALAATPWLPPGVPVLLAALGVLVALIARRAAA